jgi:hypothetical protein
MRKKKTSASSRRAKHTSVSAESIFSKPVSKSQKSVLSRIAKRQAAGDESGIDYSETLPLPTNNLLNLSARRRCLLPPVSTKTSTIGS